MPKSSERDRSALLGGAVTHPSTEPSQVTDRTDDPHIPVAAILHAIRMHIRTIVVFACFGAALSLAVVLFQRRTYVSHASFMSQSRKTSTDLPFSLGINLALGDASSPPQFYVDLLNSRALLGSLAVQQFVMVDESGKQTDASLLDILGVKGSNQRIREYSAVDRLRELIATSVVQKTGVIGLEVAAPNPLLAQQMAEALLEKLNKFNLETRQTQAGAERRFTEQRLAEVRLDLRATEDRLQDFLQANHERLSPVLMLQQGRLEREIDLQQQVYSTLAQAYEKAKLDEIRDTPVITVIEPPDLPPRAKSRRILTWLIFGWILGALFGWAFTWGRDGWRLTPSL